MITESEWLTRKKRIDGRLTALGWKIVRYSDEIDLSSLTKVAVEELPTASGPQDPSFPKRCAASSELRPFGVARRAAQARL
jgi:hypothetical protein